MGANLTDAQKNRLRKLVKEKVPALEIAKLTGHSTQTIYRYMKPATERAVKSTHYSFSRTGIDERFIMDSF